MRCPSCGWSNTLKNYPRKIKVLEKQINPDLLEHLKDLFLNKLDHINSYTLLHSCKDLEDNVLRYCINIWEKRHLEEKGFDVYYFIGILRNENKRYESKIIKERKMLEALPPDLKEN